MFLYIALIYLVLFLIVAPLWLLVDTNFKSMLLLERGKEAQRDSQRINDTLTIARSSQWFLTNDDHLFFNDNFYTQYGFENQPVKFSTLLSWISPEYRHGLENIRALGKEDSVVTQEIVMQMPATGERHVFDLTSYAAPASMHDVKRVGIISLKDDIKKEEADRREAQRKAEEARTMNTIMTTSMSEEIRNPLNAIIRNSQLLCEEFDDISEAQRRAYNDKIKEDSDKLLSFFDE